MVITPHILAGAAIGSRVHNYIAVAVLSLVIHYVVDAIPHCEHRTDILDRRISCRYAIKDLFRIALDFLGGLILIVFF